MQGTDGEVSPVLVNIGCGPTWHPAWTNLDIRPPNGQVQAWDVSKGLPFGENKVDVCYASHVLEHLSRDQARALLQEIKRALRPRGIIRLAVPDLEAIAREYLNVLTQAEKGDSTAVKQYEWITLELLDQLVRTESGGEMERYLKSHVRGNTEYIISRIGCGANEYIKRTESQTSGHLIGEDDGQAESLRQAMWSFVVRLSRLFRARDRCREEVAVGLCGILLGSRGKRAMREGLFHTSGETHRWMYDRFSLRQLLEQAGFERIGVCTAVESQIPGFTSYDLDMVEGRVRKPDSLFMEAVKP